MSVRRVAKKKPGQGDIKSAQADAGKEFEVAVSSDENENDPEFRQTRTKRRNFLFKKKIELADITQ